MTKRRNPTLAQAGEDAAVEALTALLPAGADLLVGPGDDCAVLAGSKRGEALVFKTDCLIEGVHYAPDTPPRQVGWKAMARTLSDLAAMAAEPWQALVTLAIPGDRSLRDAKALYRGMAKAAAEFGCGICGGETANPGSGGGERTVISVAMLGRMRGVKPVLRSGGIGRPLVRHRAARQARSRAVGISGFARALTAAAGWRKTRRLPR
ncbi:MAG: AIR synthase related protein [Verrucomicrobiales bacterium]